MLYEHTPYDGMQTQSHIVQSTLLALCLRTPMSDSDQAARTVTLQQGNLRRNTRRPEMVGFCRSIMFNRLRMLYITLIFTEDGKTNWSAFNWFSPQFLSWQVRLHITQTMSPHLGNKSNGLWGCSFFVNFSFCQTQNSFTKRWMQAAAHI